MIVPKRYANWLLHRVGKVVDPVTLPHFVTDSLDHNVSGPSYTDTFNRRVFNCFVGFVDLMGFSSFASGKSPKQINDFIMPFLTEIVKILTDQGCLIDKTIGDEVMFILPAPEEMHGHVAVFDLLPIFRLLSVFSKDHPEYRYRIGLSYGEHYLGQLTTPNYSEWVISGEPTIAARRVMSVSLLQNPEPALCAICSKSEDDERGKKLVDAIVTNIAKFEITNWRRLSGPHIEEEAKGIGALTYEVMRLDQPSTGER